MFEKLKSFCDSFLELGVPGFDLVVYKDGECVLRHMNGYSDIENKIRIIGKYVIEYVLFHLKKLKLINKNENQL